MWVNSYGSHTLQQKQIDTVHKTHIYFIDLTASFWQKISPHLVFCNAADKVVPSRASKFVRISVHAFRRIKKCDFVHIVQYLFKIDFKKIDKFFTNTRI
jgi:hypothetical protein